eukprot:6406446-Ditylum_brightwellii.AAC.1
MKGAFLTTIPESGVDNESNASSIMDNASQYETVEDNEVATLKNNGLKRWWHVMGTKKNYAE